MAEAPLLVIAAVPVELAAFDEVLVNPCSIAIGRAQRAARSGRLDGRACLLFSCGLGKANAAEGLAAVLESQPVAGILAVGTMGAYRPAGLKLGECALASEEIFGDEGVLTEKGWSGCETIGIPLFPGAGPSNRLRLELAERAYDHLRERSIAIDTGPLVTVSTCSGTDARANELYERWQALGESMEGAALASVARRYGVAFLEVRGVSNWAGDRDRSSWELQAAAKATVPVVRALTSFFPKVEL